MKPANIAISIIIAFILLFAAGRIINSKIENNNWIDNYGRLSYPARGKAEFTRENILETDQYTLDKIVYNSKGTSIYANLYLPNKENSPAVIIAPAARAAKEGQDKFAKFLVGKGYAVLVLDQRGTGETKWVAKDPQTEFDAFMQEKKETTEQLMVYDILKAFDVMQDIDGVDPNNIITEGESMGGRFTMIATAIEPRIKGAIIISSSGYGTATGAIQAYLDTINPDNYVQLISPRKLVMFHSPTDTVIPLEMAKNTYSLAKEPKEFIEMPQPCNHGNCDPIYDTIAEKLEEMQNS